MSKRSRSTYDTIVTVPSSSTATPSSQRTYAYRPTHDVSTRHRCDDDRRDGLVAMESYDERDHSSPLHIPATIHTTGTIGGVNHRVAGIYDGGNIIDATDSKRSSINGSSSSLSISSIINNFNHNGKVVGLTVKIPPRQLHTTIIGESKQYDAHYPMNHHQHSLHDDDNDLIVSNGSNTKRARTTTAAVMNGAVVPQSLVSTTSSMPSICALSPMASPPLPYISVTDLDEVNNQVHKQILVAPVPSTHTTQHKTSTITTTPPMSSPSLPFTHHPVSSPSSYSVSSSPSRDDDNDDMSIPVSSNGQLLCSIIAEQRRAAAASLVHLTSLPSPSSPQLTAVTPTITPSGAFSSPAHSEAQSVSSSPSHSVAHNDDDSEEAWSSSLFHGAHALPDLTRASSNDDHAHINIDYNQYQYHSHGSSMYTLPAPLALNHSISSNNNFPLLSLSSLPSSIASSSSSLPSLSTSSSATTAPSISSSIPFDASPSSLSCHRIDWGMARARLPRVWHNGMSVPSTNHLAILNYLQRLVEFVNATPLPEDVLAVCASGSFFSASPLPTLDISFRFWMRDERQKEFWRLVIKLEEFYDIRDIIADQLPVASSSDDAFSCPLAAFHAMMNMESAQASALQHTNNTNTPSQNYGHNNNGGLMDQQWLAAGLRGGVQNVFHVWLEHLFPTWSALKAARSTPHFWKRSVRVILASVLGELPTGVTLDLHDVSDSLARSPIVSPTVRISHTFPSLLTHGAYHDHALTSLQRAEQALERVLFKQACLDHLLVRLLGVSDATEYASMQSNFVGWAESIVLEWLASPSVVATYAHTLLSAAASATNDTPTTPNPQSPVPTTPTATENTPAATTTSTTGDQLPQAIAALLKSLLPGRAVRSTPANTQRVIRWRGKRGATVVLTPEDETMLVKIREQLAAAQDTHQRHIQAMRNLSLSDLHRHLAAIHERAPLADQSLRACAWVWACAQWAKRRHLAPDAITMRLAPQLMTAPAFGTTRITEAKRGNMVGRVIEYVAPGTLPASQMLVSDGHITSLVALESAPAMPPSTVPSTPPTPLQIRDALTRYSLADSSTFIHKWLSNPLGGRAALLWQRRRFAILARHLTTEKKMVHNNNDGTIHTMVIPRSLLAALPKDVFRLIAYLL